MRFDVCDHATLHVIFRDLGQTDSPDRSAVMSYPAPSIRHSVIRHSTSNHASVDVSIARYQFPGWKRRGTRDWDANWLQVAGTVVLADRKTWTFEDPCLTTWEAAELGRWLNVVADGAVRPSTSGTGQDEQMLVFTEPNVAFSLQERVADRVRVRVHFSLEALPP